MSSDGSWTSAADACRTLRITRSTLYAYVSRGFIRSEVASSASRARRYSRDDVERLKREGAVAGPAASVQGSFMS
jgi:citrate synthase